MDLTLSFGCISVRLIGSFLRIFLKVETSKAYFASLGDSSLSTVCMFEEKRFETLFSLKHSNEIQGGVVKLALI